LTYLVTKTARASRSDDEDVLEAQRVRSGGVVDKSCHPPPEEKAQIAYRIVVCTIHPYEYANSNYIVALRLSDHAAKVSPHHLFGLDAFFIYVSIGVMALHVFLKLFETTFIRSCAIEVAAVLMGFEVRIRALYDNLRKLTDDV
jgi:hypothetical protein